MYVLFSFFVFVQDLRSGRSDQIIPEAEASIQCIDVDPCARLAASVNNKGACYVWSLLESGEAARLSRNNSCSVEDGVGGNTVENSQFFGPVNRPTRMVPKMKIPAHKTYALKCKFSPDSR